VLLYSLVLRTFAGESQVYTTEETSSNRCQGALGCIAARHNRRHEGYIELEKKPVLKLDLVEEFVGKAHGDLDRVKELLAQEPALINATWDWGGGDWETALGAAAHMGRRDIALYLLSCGARIDVFAAAMLGKLDVVKAVLNAFPEARHVKGPHGIPLIAHAQAGGAEAASVFDYLQSFGGL
jgi:hypothetical protein